MVKTLPVVRNRPENGKDKLLVVVLIAPSAKWSRIRYK